MSNANQHICRKHSKGCYFMQEMQPKESNATLDQKQAAEQWQQMRYNAEKKCTMLQCNNHYIDDYCKCAAQQIVHHCLCKKLLPMKQHSAHKKKCCHHQKHHIKTQHKSCWKISREYSKAYSFYLRYFKNKYNNIPQTELVRKAATSWCRLPSSKKLKFSKKARKESMALNLRNSLSHCVNNKN